MTQLAYQKKDGSFYLTDRVIPGIEALRFVQDHQPSYDPKTQHIGVTGYARDGDVVRPVYEIFTRSDAALKADADTAWRAVRDKRNEALAASDWTQLPGGPLTADDKAAWGVYRQALRDITQADTADSVTWPVAPGAEKAQPVSAVDLGSVTQASAE